LVSTGKTRGLDDEPDEAYFREAYESFIERHRH